MSGTAQDMIDAMAAIIGTGESPAGSNHNYVTVWYGMDGEPWCDMTVTYAAYHSGNEQSVCFGSKFAYTVAHAQAFKDHGQWTPVVHDVSFLMPGDIIFFDWNGSSGNISAIDHVGVVEYVDGQNVHTIEGNIDNVCKRMVRTHEVIDGIGRPKYAPAVVVPPPVVLPKVSLALAIAAAKSPTGDVSGSTQNTTLIQNALAKLGYVSFYGRGDFGPLTKAGYSKWQQHLGYSGADADGIPGVTSLTKLGQSSGLFQEES